MHDPFDEFPENITFPNERRIPEETQERHCSDVQVIPGDNNVINLIDVISPDNSPVRCQLPIPGFPQESTHQARDKKLYDETDPASFQIIEYGGYPYPIVNRLEQKDDSQPHGGDQ
jgi:hypothetical protein